MEVSRLTARSLAESASQGDCVICWMVGGFCAFVGRGAPQRFSQS